MSELRMSAYYYSFEETGCRTVDLILSAVAEAGSRFHHTEDWAADDVSTPTPVNRIQEAAGYAATQIKALQQVNESLLTQLTAMTERADKAEKERDRLREALKTVHRCLFDPNHHNNKQSIIACTLWADNAETLHDFIEDALSHGGKE